MTKNGEAAFLQTCLQLIETQLNWGSSAAWSQYDFDRLSEVIRDRTGVRLSPTTLKRIWGKLKYESAPTLNTLNTLAQMAGYADWRHFKQAERVFDREEDGVARQAVESGSAIPDNDRFNADSRGLAQGREGSRKKPKVLFTTAGLIVLLLLAGGLTIALMTDFYPTRAASGTFAFKANKMVTEGVPNSVVFQYDARTAKTDSVFIVQTWDSRRKTRVSRHRRVHSALYYYPGFFRTKLLVDGQVAKTHDLCINTDGWLGLVEQQPVPLYFKKVDYQKKGQVAVDERTLHAYGLSLYPQAPKVRFFNQREMGDLMSDNFVFETSLKAGFSGGAGACQYVEVLIQCKDDIIIIPLSARPCIGDLRLTFCGVRVSSKEADLSGFGCDLTQWTRLRVETVKKQAAIYVNGVKAYGLSFPNDPAGIVGVQYRFDGLGAVKDTWFQHQGGFVQL